MAAGLWLHHDLWEQAHEVAQGLRTPEGSFWHAIIHRREPDAWNAKYWFRKVGFHPLYPVLFEEVSVLLRERPGSGLRLGREWDAEAWVDFWESARRAPDTVDWRVSEEVDRMERRILLDYCARQV